MTDEIHKALEVLRNKGVILYPTDTVWGIGCDATDGQAVKKVLKIKGSQEKNGLLVLMSDIEMILRYVPVLSEEECDYLERSEKPTTVIVKGAQGLADGVCASDTTLGVRIPKDNFCLNLIRSLKSPLISTSANKSGKPTPATYKDIPDAVLNEVDHIVNLRQEEQWSTKHSRILKFDKQSGLSILRS